MLNKPDAGTIWISFGAKEYPTISHRYLKCLLNAKYHTQYYGGKK